MYIAKCSNRQYMSRKLGTPIKACEKFVLGFVLIVFIIALIAGPMLLFSTINPASVPNPVQNGRLSFDLQVHNLETGTGYSIPLFETGQVTQITTLTSDQYNALNFDNSVYTYSQT